VQRPASRWFWTALVALCAAAAWARLANWRIVFPQGGDVELLPADSHYYVRFALLQLRAFPHFARFDWFVNFPTGADIYWPPLHTWAVAAAIALGGSPEARAAFVGPVLATLEVLLVGWLASRAVGRRAALGVALVLALAHAAVEVGALGNADHHVHEAAFLAAVLLAYGRAMAVEPGRWPAGTGLLVGLARLLTPFSFAALPILGGATALAALADRTGAARIGRSALRTGAWAAASLFAGALAFGEPLSLRYEGFTLFHPLLALAVMLGSAGLAFLLARDRRGLALLGAALVPLLVIAPEALRATSHLGGADSIVSIAAEASPLWREPAWALELLGPLVLGIPLALVGGARRLLRDRAAEAAPAFVGTIALAVFAAFQARFSAGLVGATAALLAHGLGAALPATSSPSTVRGFRWGIAVASLGFAGALFPQGPEPMPPDVRFTRPTLRWMRAHLPPASPDPYSGAKPDYAVAASHQLGHFIVLWAERPAIASTFGLARVHQEANRRAAAIFASTEDEQAYALARATGARYVLVTPSSDLLGFPDFDRPRSTLTQLLDHAGLETPLRPATAHFRLVHDSGEQRLRAEGGSYARLFEVVEGAVIEGTVASGAPVTARTQISIGSPAAATPYEVRANADGAGHFAVRVAYPGIYAVTASGIDARAEVAEEAVRAGTSVPVATSN
jgi:dolichyl-diphosphooligosaccharide--protein glycosyltransferase